MFGWDARQLPLAPPAAGRGGRWPAKTDEPAVVIGVVAAELLRKNVGDCRRSKAAGIPVVGVFESPAAVENGAVLMTLTQAQQITDKPGKVNILNVQLDGDATAADLEALKARVRELLPGFVAVTSGELVRQNTVVRIAKAMSDATILIASLVGIAGRVQHHAHERQRADARDRHPAGAGLASPHRDPAGLRRGGAADAGRRPRRASSSASA